VRDPVSKQGQLVIDAQRGVTNRASTQARVRQPDEYGHSPNPQHFGNHYRIEVEQQSHVL
jgi:hypothetical protein